MCREDAGLLILCASWMQGVDFRMQLGLRIQFSNLPECVTQTEKKLEE